MKRNNIKVVIILFFVMIFVLIVSLSIGEIDIPFIEVIKGVFGNSSKFNNNLLKQVRVPRTVVGFFIGATLSVSGYVTSIALKNPLADSGVLGIQSGASVGAIIALILMPSLTGLLPIFSFLGGIVAFVLLVLVAGAKRNFKPERVILIGVAINSICTSIIGIITMTNADKIKNALSWINGSIANVTLSEMKIISIYSLVLIVLLILLLPILKILLLDDSSIKNIGYNPYILRICMAFVAVILASVSVAFVGIISFIGIIAPQISRKLVKNDLKLSVISSIFIGGILVVGTDSLQRVIFSPTEIPVGILIGIIGAPMFLLVANKN